MTLDELRLMEAIVDCVPTWYVADTGPIRHAITLAGELAPGAHALWAANPGGQSAAAVLRAGRALFLPEVWR